MMQLNFNGFFKNPDQRPSSTPRLFRIQAPKKLLKANPKPVKSIWQSAGIADEPFDKLYRYAMLRTAELVQSCPATENGHHAWPGGLLTYALESADYALRLRKGVNLPISGSPEERKKKADLYTYTVFAASLIGELGALLHHQKITLYSRARGQLGEWSPLAREIDSNSRARFMKVEFRRGREEINRAYSLMYAMRILSGEGLEWIESDTEVLGEFLQAFSDRPGGPIHDLATRGRKASEIRAEPHAGTPHFGIEPGPPATRAKESRKESSPGSGSPKKAGRRQTAGSKGAVKPGVQETAATRKAGMAAMNPEPQTKSGPAREVPDQTSSATPIAGKVKETETAPAAPGMHGKVPGGGFTDWVERLIRESGDRQGKGGKLFHVTEGHIFLVHPTVFVQYASENSVDWNTVEREFASLEIHEKNPKQKNRNLWKARVPGRKEGAMGLVTGWLVPKAKLNLDLELEPDRELKLLDLP